MAVNADKLEYAERMNALLDKYSKVLFCKLDNVTSAQMHSVRIALRGRAEVLVGKKTMQKKILRMRADSDNASAVDKELAKILCEDNKLVGNLAMVFTNEDALKIQEVLSTFRKQAPARIGAISPVDVTIAAGNTGLEPGMTSFFQALNIQTKITKGTVEITADRKVLNIGDKVDSSTAALLTKLNISPFWYCAEVEFYISRGILYTAADLKVTNAVMEETAKTAISNLTALSLATGILTEASFPHAIMDGFKNLLAASVETEYTFSEYNGEKLRSDIKSGKCVGAASAAPAAAAGGASKAAAAPAPVEEEEDEDMGLGLFD
jgi:large subunit ribosomal protein LP0